MRMTRMDITAMGRRMSFLTLICLVLKIILSACLLVKALL